MFVVHPVRYAGEGLAVKILGPCVLESCKETQVLSRGIATREKPRMKIGLKDRDPSAADSGLGCRGGDLEVIQRITQIKQPLIQRLENDIIGKDPGIPLALDPVRIPCKTDLVQALHAVDIIEQLDPERILDPLRRFPGHTVAPLAESRLKPRNGQGRVIIRKYIVGVVV